MSPLPAQFFIILCVLRPFPAQFFIIKCVISPFPAQKSGTEMRSPRKKNTLQSGLQVDEKWVIGLLN